MMGSDTFKIGILVLTLISATPAGADYEAGQRAWNAGQREAAVVEWQRSAQAGDARAMLALGRLYVEGVDLLQDYVQAYKWFSLAASRGERAAVAERDALADQMTLEERAEARKLALEWRPGSAAGASAARPAAGQGGESPETIREMQILLANLGYQPGVADGVAGQSTTQALEAFLRDSGLPRPNTLTETLGILQDVAQRSAVPQTENTPFKDCPVCPEVIMVPAGAFTMGSPATEEGRKDAEGPQREVRIAQPLAVGIYEVTFAEWDACVNAGGCNGYRPDDAGWNRGRQPVINVSWEDAQAYVAWLAEESGQPYRLLSEAEWEYVARAGMPTPFHTGRTIRPAQANYYSRYNYAGGEVGRNRDQPLPVGSFQPNAFGLYDMHGNAWEWVQDCWNMNYSGAPEDGRAWETGDCDQRVARGGSWYYAPAVLRSASRERYLADFRDTSGGFRIARTATPEPEPPPTIIAEPPQVEPQPPTIIAEPPQVEPQPFTVVAEPSAARVRILNIEERYQAGMGLPAGAYQVEVSAAGYETTRETIAHGSEATERRITLARVGPQPFTVMAEPPGAQVRILNTEEEYAAGMALAPGEYEVEVSAPGHETVRETITHRLAATERRISLPQVGPQPFTIVAEPGSARVRILNTEEEYTAGMALAPGEYEVEVSAPGHETVRETITHRLAATERRISLPQVGPQPFTIVAEPGSARVQILNIAEPYRTGMALAPGEYEVEVSAPGHETVRETIQHGLVATDRWITLVPGRPQPTFTSAPVPLVQVPPNYPRRAVRMNIEGSATVEFTITRDGSVIEPVIVEADPPNIFDQAALQAIVQWKFQPQVEDGRTVEARARQRIEFGL